MATVYILYSQKTDRFYIGSTTDLERRLRDHNYGNTQSTRHGKPWMCVYKLDCVSLSDARRIEKGIKRQKSRAYINKIISEQLVSV